MAYDYILYEKRRQGVLITLNRPDQMNALNDQHRDELDHALDEAEVDPEVRAQGEESRCGMGAGRAASGL